MDPHARAFSFSRERARLNPIPDDLVVSDSDPESIGKMDNLTTKPAASRSHQQSKAIKSNRIRARGSIIELSDDSSRQPSIAGIIELSDDSDSLDGLGAFGKGGALPSSRQPPQTPQTLPVPPRLAVPISNGQIIEIDGSESDSETPSIDLSRFAYATKPFQPRQQTPASSMKSTRATLPSNTSNTRMIHSATDFLTDREIGRLSRCVACGIAWTTKKTIPKKRHHIRLCQKKNDLTDDTIHLLVEKELAQSAEDAATKGKGKSKELFGQEKALTLMKELVHDAQPKKRGKRKEMPPTIVGIEHQHETIQQHAKRLFDLDSDDDDNSKPGISATTSSTTFPLTQEFPVSKLASGKIFQTDIATSLPSPLPSDDEDKPISVSSDSKSSALENYSSHFLQGNERHRRLPSALRQSLTWHDGEDQWMEDLQREIDTRESVAQWLDTDMPDAWGMATHLADVEKETTAVHSAVSKKKLDPPPKSISQKKLSNPRTPVKQRPTRLSPYSTIPSTTSKLTAKGSGATSPIKGGNLLQDAHDQENFNHLMQERIKQNTVLWHRVLRYEPVNFTEFLDIALSSGVPSKKLTDKLRIFLISRAIHTSMPRKERRR